MTEQIAKIHQQSTEVEQPPTRLEIDKEVDVTRFGRVTPGHRAEDPDPRSTAGMCDAEDLAATRPQVGQHRDGHCPKDTPDLERPRGMSSTVAESTAGEWTLWDGFQTLPNR